MCEQPGGSKQVCASNFCEFIYKAESDYQNKEFYDGFETKIK